MKKIILLLVAAGAGFSAMAQVRGGDNYYAQKCVIDLNLPVGLLMQTPTYKFDANYPNVLNTNIGKMKMSAGASYGVDGQFGYFIGKKRRWGIGTGFMYMSQMSNASISDFHVDYQATDSKDNTYRQLVTATAAVKEDLKITQMNIPLVIKYKQRFTTKIAFTADAGILYNLQMTNKWTTNGEFDYEAIYQFATSPSGALVTVYDNNPTPSTADWLITKAQYEKHNSIGTLANVFDSLRLRGYNVALGVKPTNNSGTVNYTTGSIGYIIRPAINIRLMERVHLNLGVYYMYQSFNNNTVNNYRMIDNMGKTYSSMLNTVSTMTSSTMGINVGLRYFIGEAKDKNFDGKYDE